MYHTHTLYTQETSALHTGLLQNDKALVPTLNHGESSVFPALHTSFNQKRLLIRQLSGSGVLE